MTYVSVMILLFTLLPFTLPRVQTTSTSSERGMMTGSGDLTRSALLESGKPIRPRTTPNSVQQLRVISYNIRWRSGDELKRLIELFRDDAEIGNAAVLALQEVDRHKERTKLTNTVKQIADELQLHYAWTAPPTPDSGEEETGVAILSLYPLSDITRIVLPHEGPNRRRRVALGATISIGSEKLRVYSVHSETRIAVAKKVDQWKAVIDDLDSYPKDMPAIIMGDFNTWEINAGSKTTKLFSEAGFQTPFGEKKTFSRHYFFVPIELRLDWVWLRGLNALSHGVDTKISISDHWPLWTNLQWQAKK